MSKNQTIEFTVDEASKGMRLDIFLTESHKELTRSQCQKWIKAGHVTINKAVEDSPKYTVSTGQNIVLKMEGWTPHIELNPAPMDLQILFEDDAVLVINKPAGLVAHPGVGTFETTLLEGILHYLGVKSPKKLGFESDRAGMVHRLDRDTSGALVYAKTPEALASMQKQFEQKTNFREYYAVILGKLPADELTLETLIARDPNSRIRMLAYDIESNQAPEQARMAKSHFVRHKTYSDDIELIKVQLETGRTHQIRVHAQHLGLSILGDPVYGLNSARQTIAKIRANSLYPKDLVTFIMQQQAQMLHAAYLGFNHPISDEKIAFYAPLPKLFLNFLELAQLSSDTFEGGIK